MHAPLHMVLLPLMSNGTDRLLDFNTHDNTEASVLEFQQLQSENPSLNPFPSVKMLNSLSPNKPRGKFIMPDCKEANIDAMPCHAMHVIMEKNEGFLWEDSGL
jgi:hypothetical protein